MTSRLAGHILVDQLVQHGTDMAFGVPGESFLAVLDGFYQRRDAIRFITCRQEGGAANMAEAYGKLTGTPGVCFVTRGPGATNASIGVHTAFQDSTPMILFIGQVGSDFRDREAFQEVDYRQMFGPLAKHVEQIDRADRIPEYVSRAYHIATNGRPGPVVLVLPEDMLSASADVPDMPRYERSAAAPRTSDLAQLQTLLDASEKPIVLLGGSGWTTQACKDVQQFAEKHALPVACAFRFQDLFDNTHQQYIGDVGIGISPALAKRVKEADLIIAIGPRLGEMTTGGYALLEAPRSKQKLVHIHQDANELGRVYRADLMVNASMPEMARALTTQLTVSASPRWKRWLADARKDYEANIAPAPMTGKLDLGQCVKHLREALPADAIITNGAGNYTGWVHRYYQYRGLRTQLAPTSGAMGYGVPAAIAAKLKAPERSVIAFAGDGCFMMTGQELATAVQYRANIVICVVNNGLYGTIRMHQARDYPGRISATELWNPDFVKLADAYGAHGERVMTTDQFPAAFDRARNAGRPALLELVIDPDVITTRTTLRAMEKV